MKKQLLVFAPAFASLFLAGCGGSTETTSNTQTSAESSLSSEASNTSNATSASNSGVSSSSSKAQYLITFKDEEGTTLDARNYEEGSTPSYHYDKQDTQEWDYTFLGWSTSLGGAVITIPVVSEEATYYAVVNKIKQQYTLTFVSNGGSSVAPITADYGTAIDKPNNPSYHGYHFSGWSFDQAGKEKVTWPYTLTEDKTVYANWNEAIDIKGYLTTLKSALNQDPYSYIPEAMLPSYAQNHVSQEDVTYDFIDFVNVSAIRYGGFGEQWNMVLTNLRESQRFYTVLSLIEAGINSSVVVFNNYLDNNPGSTASHSVKETSYTASLDYHNGVLSYVLQYKTGWNIPFFGEILPQIDMTYDIDSNERSVRIQLTENNAMRYVVGENSYTFAIEYGVTALSRKAYFEIRRNADESVTGHIYEFIQLQGQDRVASCADFYIDDGYVSVAGNKASGMPGFTGYINELYKADQGKLLGYETRETFTKWSVTATYHTLWFNLCDIANINSVKAIKNDSSTFGLASNNPYDIYLNGSSSIFEPTYNYKLLLKTSRKYDVEMRKQYFYGYVNNELTEFEVLLPMMFIQADHDGYTNFSDFPSNILEKSNIAASVTLNQVYLDKIQADYATIIDAFIANKDAVSGDVIADYIGDATVIEEEE